MNDIYKSDRNYFKTITNKPVSFKNIVTRGQVVHRSTVTLITNECPFELQNSFCPFERMWFPVKIRFFMPVDKTQEQTTVAGIKVDITPVLLTDKATLNSMSLSLELTNNYSIYVYRV